MTALQSAAPAAAAGPFIPTVGANRGEPMSGSAKISAETTVFATFFDDWGAHAKIERVWQLGKLAETIRNTNRNAADAEAAKAVLPWLKLARFGNAKTKNDSLRHDRNVLACTGIEGDFDKETISFEEAVEIAEKAGLGCLIYTSPRHLLAGHGPRWRILCPTSTEITPKQRALLVSRINGLFRGSLAPESWKLSQSYYFGSVNGNPAHDIALIEGEPIDLLDELDRIAVDQPKLSGRHAGKGAARPSGDHQPSPLGITADALDIAAALAAIDNDEVDWERWSYIGMAIWAATAGSAAGYAAFLAWSEKIGDGDFDEAKTRARWEGITRSPPDGGIGAGTLFHLAREAWPGWEKPSEIRQRRDNDPGSPPPHVTDPPPPADDHHTSTSWATGDDKAREFPVMVEEAFYGLPGEIVRTIEPHTESSSTTLLMTLHVYFGNALGRGPYYQVEGTRHYTNLYSLLVGETGKSRKGTGDGRIRQIFYIADRDWCQTRIQTALGSGEGLVHEIRDRVEREGEDGPAVVDAGVADKRLLVVQSEFVGALRVMRREGNPLSAVMRDAWDGTPLGTMIKSSRDRCAEPHVGMLGHITEVELRRELDELSMANGFGNRFLFACVRRARLLPFGGSLPVNAVMEMAEKVSTAIQRAREIERVEWSAEGAEGWDAIYPQLSSGRPGLLGALTNRAEAQVARLALIYALWDGSSKIELKHLLAAQGVWDYCEASVRHIFGASLGDPIADTILTSLRKAGKAGLSRTEISGLFSRNASSGRITLALKELLELRLATTRHDAPAGGGRPVEIWTAGVEAD
jgi:hypothetical protein